MTEYYLSKFVNLFQFLFDTEYVASSAKRINCVNPPSRLRGRSLIKIRNNKGPSIEPCGTPYVTCNGSDSFDLYPPAGLYY